MKKIFEEPKMDVEIFPVEDVITASSGAVVPQNDEDELVIAYHLD